MIDLYGWIMTYLDKEEEDRYPPYIVAALKLTRDKENRLMWVSYIYFCSPLPNIWALEIFDKFETERSHDMFECLKQTHFKLSDEVFYVNDLSEIRLPAKENIWKLT